MKKTINGKEYEQVQEPTIKERKKFANCVGCVADNDEILCFSLSKCRTVKMIWKEVKDDSASKDV